MKLKFFFLSLTCSVGLFSQTSTWYTGSQARIDTLRKGSFTIKLVNQNRQIIQDSIRVIHKKHEFPWGTAVDLYSAIPITSTTTEDWYRAITLRYANCGVTGNQFKWSGIEAAGKGQLTYAPFENTLAWFNKIGFNMKGHTLLWGGYSNTDYHSIPKWVMDLSATPKTMYAECKNRVTREVTRYKGKVKEYDVLNEPTHATTLQGFVGDSINWNCFKWAHEADSTAKLYLNDYNIIEYQDQTNNYVALVKKMLQKGAPISGIGAQCHIGESVDVVNFKSRFDQLAQFGFPVKVTEFDMNAINVTQQKYATEIAKMMRLAFSHPGLQGFIFWGFTEPTWAKGIINIIREDKTPRLAADTVYNLIHNVWSTKLSGRTDNFGEYNFKGYYGDYEIQAKLNGSWKKFNASCLKANRNSTITLIDTAALAISPKLIKVKTLAGKGVELTFDKKMVTPAASDYSSFKVFESVNNYVRNASLKSGDSTIIVLTMSTPTNIKDKSYLPVVYFPGNVRSKDGGKLEFFGPIIDNSVVPAYLSSKTSPDGNTVNVFFDKKVLSSTVNKSNFIVKKNGVAVSILQADLSAINDTLKMKLATQIADTADVILVSYTSGDLKTTDSLYVTTFSNKSVTNALSVAKVSSAMTSTDGKILQIDFSANLNDPLGLESNFNVLVNTQSVGITSAKLSTVNKKRIFVTLDGVVHYKDSVKISLIQRGSFMSEIGVPVPLFTKNVTNKSVIVAANDELEDFNLNCFPNPFENTFTVQGSDSYSQINIYNELGVKVFNHEINSTTEVVDVSKLRPGMYFMEFVSKNRRTTRKVVKK